ncbi:hypothetical protein DUNSADRAFT_5211 [Dunaliella salina]|uniref:Uncharacterized protein n=1 Tax=Dunaliella salina TaxID=3046 RepID=A0ABQ7GQQ6_DUNSA|nr:hypothetical protein DUNSADRAFT_5211 [Dunaliella salina]|eukprot:KAF5836934.1 hypothetical protein DUNSADRAFT_5211 [Dunaliella salina]
MFHSCIRRLALAPPSSSWCSKVLSHTAPVASHQSGWRQFSDDGNSEARASAEKLLDMMASTPAMQQMMLASLPSSLPASERSPEAIKRMLSNPHMREQMITMIAKQNIKLPVQAINNMSAKNMEETFSRAKRLGIDPARIFQKLVSHPEIFKKLQQPHVLRAFLEVSRNPAALSSYDLETIEVVRKVRDILERPTESSEAAAKDADVVSETSSSSIPLPDSHDVAPTTGLDPPPSRGATTTDAEFKPSSSPQAPQASSSQASLIAACEQHPIIGPKLQDPKIRKAVEEVAVSPWKTVKYIFNREVMDVFSEMNKLLKGE